MTNICHARAHEIPFFCQLALTFFCKALCVHVKKSTIALSDAATHLLDDKLCLGNILASLCNKLNYAAVWMYLIAGNMCLKFNLDGSFL